MASTVVGSTIKLTRGVHTFLGNLTSNAQVIQFTIPEPTRDNQGFLIIQSNGTLTGTGAATMEVSVDQGQTWSTLGTSSTIVLSTTGNINSDPAAAAADAFQVSGMGGGVLFRYGFPSTMTTVTVAVWACVG